MKQLVCAISLIVGMALLALPTTAVHRATFLGTGEFEEKTPDGQETKYKKSVTLECFPESLLLVHDGRRWWFRNVKEERDDDKQEKIDGKPVFAQGWSKGVIDLYRIPANENEARFEAEFNYLGRDWKVKFRAGIRSFPCRRKRTEVCESSGTLEDRRISSGLLLNTVPQRLVTFS